MAITTAEALLAVLEKSGLLTKEQFAEAQDATLLTSDAVELADMLVRQDVITSWQAGQLLAGRSTLFLGNYALMDVLGRGGMGSVFLAKHKTMKRRVALKVVSKQVGKNPASLERFLAEARAVAALDHPNIVRAYDVGKESDRFYIVMEYVEGQDLEAIVREFGLLGYEEAADCIRQAADGLAHAHGRNMVHCDIKPSNLLLSDQGTIKILDMGMARLIGDEEDSSEHHEHKILGTVDYMAPEQAMETPDFDHRADIYSLGCTLYFLLTGRPPFDSGTLTQRIVKHQTQEPPDVLQLQPDAPRDLVAVCRKMMAKNPADRYQSAKEISRLLTGWRAPSPAAADDEPAEARKYTQPGKEPLAGSPPPRPAGSLAMEELKAAGEVVAGPVLQSKKKKPWSEEQQTVLLVASAVFFAIIILSVALLVMALRGEPSDLRETVAAQNDQISKADVPATVKDDGAKITKTEIPRQELPPKAVKPPKAAKAVQTPKAEKKTDKGTSGPEPAAPSWANMPLLNPDENKAQGPGPGPGPKGPSPDKTAKTQPQAAGPKAAETKAVEPFGDLPAAVDLQLLPSSSRRAADEPSPPFKLALLHPPADAAVKIELVGGDAALVGRARFVLAPTNGEEGNKSDSSWLVRLEKGGKEGEAGVSIPPAASAVEPADVARIRYGQGVLVFEWLESAVAETANQLKNCALDITIDGKTKTLPLSRPRPLGPLLPDMITGTAALTLTGGCLPDPDSLRLEITALECGEKSGLMKQNLVVKARDQTDIEMSIGKLKNLVARVSYSIASGQTKVTLECFCKLSGSKRLTHLKLTEWNKLDSLAAGWKETIKKLEADIAKKKSSPAASARNQQRLSAIKSRCEEAEALLRFMEAVHGKGKVYFREYVEDGPRHIELSNSDVPPEPKEEGQ